MLELMLLIAAIWILASIATACVCSLVLTGAKIGEQRLDKSHKDMLE